MDLPTAFRMFMTRSKMVNGLPFEAATLPQREATRTDGLEAFWDARQQLYNESEMTLDEINAEISDARVNRRINDEHI